MKRRRLALLFVGIACVSLLLYTPTAPRYVGYGDTAEFQRVVRTLDLPHPTGYPLYMLLGNVWTTLLRLGTPAWRLNILSALCAALTAATVSVTLQRLFGNLAVSLLGAVVLLAAPAFWSQAVISEVYALHALLVALLMWLLASQDLRTTRGLSSVTFVMGLALTHHRMALMLLPAVAACLLYEYAHGWRPSFRLIVIATGAFLLGLLPYAFTYIRGDWTSFAAFWSYVGHAGESWWSTSGLVDYFRSTVWPLLGQQMGVVGASLGLLGIVAGLGSRRQGVARISWFLLVAWPSAMVFLTVYRVPDLHAFFTHLQVLQAIAIGFGVAAILDWMHPRIPARQYRVASAVLPLLLVGIATPRLVGEFGAARQLQDNRRYYDASLSVMKVLESDAVIVASWDNGHTLRYEREVDGLRNDLTVVVDPQPGTDPIAAFSGSDRPIYLENKAYFDGERYSEYGLIAIQQSRPQPGLYRVVERNAFSDAAVYEQEVNQPTSQGVVLEKLRLAPWPIEADQLVKLELCWRGSSADLPDWTGRLTIGADTNWLNEWFPLDQGEAVADCHAYYFVAPPAALAGTAESSVRIFRPSAQTADLSVSVPSVPLKPRALPRPFDRLVNGEAAAVPLETGGLRLVGASNDESTSPGITFPLVAYWLITGNGAAAGEDPLRLELVDPAGEVVDLREVPLPSTSAFPEAVAGAAIASQHEASVPRAARPGKYTLRLARTGAPPVPISSIEVEDFPRRFERPSMANETDYSFGGDAILLEGYDTAKEPGNLDVTLYWKSLRAVQGNWKVFVHLVDSAGNLVAQSDSFPVSGTRWTDTWRAGEYIADDHVVGLPAHLSSGPYRVLVGLYDPASGERVAVSNRSGPSATRDHGELGEVWLP